MNGDLVPYDDIDERQTRGAIGITAITRLKHADLLAAAKLCAEKIKANQKSPGRYGGQSALARKLKVTAVELGTWINLQRCPPTEPVGKWTASRIVRLEAALLKLTGKSMEELFPPELRANIKFLAAPKLFEKTVRVEQQALAYYADATRERMLLTQNPELSFSADELKEKISAIISTFTPKEQAVLAYRYGLNGQPILTYEEIGNEIGVRKERARQIEAKAMRKLQTMAAEGKLKNLRAVVDANFE